MASDALAPPPIPFVQLKNIADEACENTFASVTSYHHPSTQAWNTAIINTILAALIKSTTSSNSTPTQSPYKFAVTSTIIEHVSSGRSASTTGAKPEITTEDGAATVSSPPTAGGGRRGMHSATGAYWNTEKDGMWSYKYEAGEGKGLDVVIGILWIAV